VDSGIDPTGLGSQRFRLPVGYCQRNFAATGQEMRSQLLMSRRNSLDLNLVIKKRPKALKNQKKPLSVFQRLF